jgi:hypothetical protein
MKWRKYENAFLISAEQVVQQEENHRNRDSGDGKASIDLAQ